MSKGDDTISVAMEQVTGTASKGGISVKVAARNIVRDYGIYIALAGVVIFFSIFISRFRTFDNVILILLQVSVTGIMSIGMLFVILSAGIDLSVGAILAVAGMISGIYAQMEPTAMSVILALGFPLAIGLFCGVFNGFVISYLNVAPLIVTLGTMYAYRGFVVWYRVNPIYNLSSWYRVIGQQTIGPVPIPVIILLIIAGLASIVLNFTRFGRYVYAIGGNRQAARAAGINVKLVELGVYVISGFCCGLAGLVFTSRLGAAQAISGLGFELTCIASVVVGGASLFGGRGTVGQTMVGALIIGVLSNGLVMLNVPSPIQQMIIGMIIIAAVWVDSVLRRRV
jgi:ribose/xylose/arabinose/galactoside ABC-type transport system permease subunit